MKSATGATYAYSAGGERVLKGAVGSDTYSVHDAAGRWIGDYDTNGTPIQQAVWLGDLPVGVLRMEVDTFNKLYYVEPDALGTPRVVINPSSGSQGVVVWRWDLAGAPFGNAEPESNGFVFDMRFPGQRYDSATGLNYNYFRDYDPAIGRYVQSDPIGLDGGASTYGYVGGNPATETDTFGLQYAEPSTTAFCRQNPTACIIEVGPRPAPRFTPPPSPRPVPLVPPKGSDGCCTEYRNVFRQMTSTEKNVISGRVE